MGCEFGTGSHESGETSQAECINLFDSTENLTATDSSSLAEDEMTAPRSKKRLTAIQELANDAEAAEEYLRQDRHSQLLVSFNPEIRQPPKGCEPSQSAAKPIPVPRPVQNLFSEKEGLGSQDPPSCGSPPNKKLAQPVPVEENGVAMPKVSCNNELPYDAVSENARITEYGGNETKEVLHYPVKYGTSSENEGFSLVDIDSAVAEGSAPSHDQANVVRLNRAVSEDRFRPPTPYPSSSNQSAAESRHVGDLLHFSPGPSRTLRSSSLPTSEINGLRAPSKPSPPQQVILKTTKASASIPNISTELLNSLDGKEKDVYLGSAITQAKKNSAMTGIPFLIMKDGRSCVANTKEYEIEFINSPEDWKKAVLAKSNGNSEALVQSQDLAGREHKAKQINAWERIQKALRFNTSHNNSRNTPHDITHNTYEPTIPAPDHSSVLTPSFGNEKAHRTLGIIGDTVAVPSGRHDQQPRKNSISSTTDAISIMTFPPRSTPGRSTLDFPTRASPSKYSRGSPSVDVRSRQSRSKSPYKYGVDSPSRQRQKQLPDRSTMLKSVKLPELRNVASFLSDASRDCPVKANLEEIGRAVTTPDEVLEDPTMSEGNVDSASISSSTYRGDESCVQGGQAIRIHGFPANGSTNLEEGMGLIEKMEAKRKLKKAEEVASLARAAARLAPSTNTDSTGQKLSGFSTRPSSPFHSHSVNESYSSKEKTHMVKAFRAKKPTEEPNTLAPIGKTSDPFAGMQRAYRMLTAKDTGDVRKSIGTNSPRYSIDGQHMNDITHPAPLGSNVPTNGERAHARAITEHHRAANEKAKIAEESLAGPQNHAAEGVGQLISDAGSAKDLKVFGRSPVKNVMHSIGSGIKEAGAILKPSGTMTTRGEYEEY